MNVEGLNRRKKFSDTLNNEKISEEKETTLKKLSDNWIQSLCLLRKGEIHNFDAFVEFLHKPTWPSSLGVVRALFGLMMVIDIPDERGLSKIDLKYGDPMRCHFPLFDFLIPMPLEYMGLLYCIMWLGAFGICLGFRFQTSCLMFVLPYWYIYLLDKTAWNNHSYLYGLVSVLFTFTSANHSFSVDALLNPSIKDKPVPLWNYAIIRFQFFLLYFYAGVKKFDSDWIGGYSMTKLSLHWVFDPFRLVLNDEQIDFWIIHIFGFVFDLTVGFFLLVEKTRPVAMIFSTAFHVMNSCMFFIGQFPYVCVVTTPIFCGYDWPEQIQNCFTELFRNVKQPHQIIRKPKRKIVKDNAADKKVTGKQKMTCYLLASYISLQLFLPFSHFITQGYNNWTNGLYGYSWDMMVQNWSSNLIIVRVVDNQSKEEFFLDPEAWVGSTKYTKHGDMLIQYAKCLKRNLQNPDVRSIQDHVRPTFSNISVYIDVWSSLNGRFQQRMFNPKQDLLTAEWNPFEKISWLMPLLTELTPWRENIERLQNEVFGWSNYSDVLFVADFPGLHIENYISPDFTNVTITVLQGSVVLEQLNHTKGFGTFNHTLCKGDSIDVKEGLFHKVYTISEEPSCYMYTYNNYTMQKSGVDQRDGSGLSVTVIKNMLVDSLMLRIKNFSKSLMMLQACFNKVFFNVPIPPKNKMFQP